MNMHRTARRLSLLLAALVIAGCANVTKVDTGEALVRNRLAVTVASPWNQFERGLSDNTPTWTIEGITVDALQFYVGIKDGEAIAPAPAGDNKLLPLTFKSSMQPADVVALYQGLFTRDGSSFTLEKLEPAEFVGTRGFRFEYSLTRKVDDVRLRGVAYGAVRQGELFVINYSAPRLAFYPKYVGQVEALAKTARVKG
ncbi:hypothetical protein BURC_01388 [Burkholderiaceae bacterium]|nr:hypothetical protein BURC_01388 [Burkholderiaceae bacterium]